MLKIESGVPLKNWTWWKIGGPADHFCLPENVEEVREACEFALTRSLPITVLGGGTNVLVSDAGVEGLVICMRKLTGISVVERDGRLELEALAGTPKAELTKNFLRRKLTPALFLCGLPGDVGGGVVMNAGVSEQIVPREFVEITDWVEWVELPSLKVQRRSKAEFSWKYRSSSGWQPGVIVRAGFSWPLEMDNEIQNKVKEATRNRLKKQPLELPSCGSTFKNPPGETAGSLIDRCGLKGYRVGGAEVSTKHANFIVNIADARASDVRSIINYVREKVKEKFGMDLETEVRFLGRDMN